MKRRFGVVILAALAMLGPGTLRSQVVFLPLGYLDGFGPTSEAIAMSADGSRVVGYSTTTLTSNRACWWTDSGIAAIPGAQDWHANAAYGISADGSVIVGANSFGDTERAFYWTAAGNTEYVPMPPPPAPAQYLRASGSWDVSANGRVIVGSVTYTLSELVNSTRFPRSFRWSPGEATATLLPQFAGDFKSDTAFAANHDGSLIVGTAFTSLTTQTAVYWDSTGGPYPIGNTGDPIQTVSANAITPDGRIIVGSGVDTTTGNGVAFKWTAESGTVALSAPTTGVYAYSGITCYSISGDGRVIVGHGENIAGREEAIYWIDEQPNRVSDTAFAGGVLPAQWEPFRAYGVDYHGNSICGYGQATSGKLEAFLLILDNTPEPPDLDGLRIRLAPNPANAELAISFPTVPGVRYRVVGGEDVSSLLPLGPWEDGLGFDASFTATSDLTGDASEFFLSVETIR